MRQPICYTEIMAASIPDIHFGARTYIREALKRKASRKPVCGEKALACETRNEGIHFCCSASKIVNTTLEAPLSWADFAATLQHYEIRISEKDAREAYVDCLAEACLEEKIGEISAMGSEFASISEAAEEAEGTGDTETARKLQTEANSKAMSQMMLVRSTRAKAESLASVL